uniref:Uncharacterized protein n=1 Tax=Glossina pallidipes TaxID=7398 RepID=A0A1A9ZXE5_GLOPL
MLIRYKKFYDLRNKQGLDKQHNLNTAEGLSHIALASAILFKSDLKHQKQQNNNRSSFLSIDLEGEEEKDALSFKKILISLAPDYKSMNSLPEYSLDNTNYKRHYYHRYLLNRACYNYRFRVAMMSSTDKHYRSYLIVQEYTNQRYTHLTVTNARQTEKINVLRNRSTIQ